MPRDLMPRVELLLEISLHAVILVCVGLWCEEALALAIVQVQYTCCTTSIKEQLDYLNIDLGMKITFDDRLLYVIE